jgi:hypothetical protein
MLQPFMHTMQCLNLPSYDSGQVGAVVVERLIFSRQTLLSLSFSLSFPPSLFVLFPLNSLLVSIAICNQPQSE